MDLGTCSYVVHVCKDPIATSQLLAELVCRAAAGPQVFDRPFLFFVVETTTQTVLFQGVITDPSSK